MEEAEACHARHDEIRQALRAADDQWWALESRLERAEELVLETHGEALKGWFGLKGPELADWSESGLRTKVRGRVHNLLLAPLAERMRRQVDFFGPPPTGPDKENQYLGHVIDELLDRWESEVDTLVGEADTADERLARRARRRAKFGAAPEALTQADAKQRLAAWAPARGALEAFEEPVQRLSEFVRTEVSEEAIARLASIVPLVVARAVCDFNFQGHAAEFEQLEAWWDGAKAALQRREGLWQRLLQEEGLFVRRIERGIEALRAAGHRYQAYADFGAGQAVAAMAVGSAPVPEGGWPAEAVSLLASATADFRKRLRPIRDCAAWRVVEAAKSIHRQLRTDSPSPEQPQWDLVHREEGAVALCKALGEQAAVPADGDPADVALVLMQRLDGLAALLKDLRDAFHAEVAPGAGGVGDLLAEVMQAAAAMSEELLGLLDDPSQAALDEWTGHWDRFAPAAGGSQRLEASMAIMPPVLESSLPLERRNARRQRLLLLRGVQAMLEDSTFRRLLAGVVGVEAAGATEARAAAPGLQKDVAGLALCLPPAEAAPAVESPRSGYVPRRPRREAEGSSCAESPRSPFPFAAPAAALAPEAPAAAPVAAPTAQSPAVAAPVAAAEPETSELPAQEYGRLPTTLPAQEISAAEAAAEAVLRSGMATARSGMATASSSRPETPSTRPATPSWLQPPWPRPSTPGAASWTRPDTPSTACDDAEATSVPRWKFVNGEYVQMRPNSSAARLPPLMPSQMAAKPRQAAAPVW